MRPRRRSARRVRREPATPQPPKPQAPPRSSTRTATARSWLRRAGMTVLFLVILASAVNILSLSPSAKVVPLTTNDNSLLRPAADYEVAADRQLDSSIWNRNKVTINTSNLSQQLLKQFPELKTVSVTVPLLAHRPVVYVEPAQPALILVTADNSYIIDTAGKALISASKPDDFQTQTKLPLLNDQSGLRIEINRQALPADNVKFIRIVVAELATRHFKVASLTLPAHASELDVHLVGQPYLIKFNLQDNSPREQAGTFLAAIIQLKHQHVTPAHYVDVRVGGRAYYK